MPGFIMEEDSSDEEFLYEDLNDNYGRYIVDINYNRPLKNFPLTLNKIDEVDETSIKSPEAEREKSQDENGNMVCTENRRGTHVAWNPREEVIPLPDRCKGKPRPKSASCAGDDGRRPKEKNEKRPRSSCAGYPSRIPVKKKEYKGVKIDSDCSSSLSIGDEDVHHESGSDGKMSKRKTRYKSLENVGYYDDEFVSFGKDYHIRPTSACCMRPHPNIGEKKQTTKRSNSQPNIPLHQSSTNVWCEVSRFRRSLRLLGLSNSDFGLPDSPKYDVPPSRPRSSHGGAPTFSTRVLQRSFSLDYLREAVREASREKYPGLPQRRQLAQAAYEEWYFKKSGELSQKLKEEKEKNEEVKIKLEEEKMLRLERAGEQYHKWVETKKKQDSDRQGKRSKLNAKIDNKLIKSKEEIDKAYLEWKKQKQQILNKKKKSQQAEEEKVQREKMEKEEKMKQAEKAFKEWKNKLEETQRINKEKERVSKKKIMEQITARSKSSTSFQVWKEHKDDELKTKWKKARNAAKMAEDARSMIVTERMYEAEQAFEEWLEKVDIRAQKGSGKSRVPKTTVPWAPS